MSVRFLPMLCSGAILFASTLGYVVVPMSYSRTLLTLVVLSAIALLLLFIFHREDCPWLKGQSAKCSTFFLLGFTVVHFQNYVDLILGNCLPDDSFLMVDSRLICKAAILSLIALSAFFCGYFLKQGKVLQTPVTPVFVPLSPLIIFSTILFPIWLYSVGQEYLSGGYGRNVENGVLSSYLRNGDVCDSNVSCSKFQSRKNSPYLFRIHTFSWLVQRHAWSICNLCYALW